MKYVIIPYKIGSQSAKKLQESIKAAGHRCVRVRPDSTTYRARPTDKIIYYGGSTFNFHSNKIINRTRGTANNKLYTFRKLQEAGLSTVEWTTDPAYARQQWDIVVIRETLHGHSGEGIRMWYKEDANAGDDLGHALLYTKYQKKTYECRVHVFNGVVIDAQIKRKKVTDATQETNTTIRNVHTGWVYCREDFVLPDEAAQLSIAAVQAVGLDFGAVDLIYNKHYNKFYILEINSAPGIEGTTLNNYVQTILAV